MDPALWQLLRREQAVPGRDVEAIIRLRQPQREVPGVRLIAHFGHIATCRLPLAAVRAVRRHPNVASLKAARTLAPERQRSHTATATAVRSTDMRRPEGTGLTGAGVVVGVADWGLDVNHPTFRRGDGTTRVLALWDQRDGPSSPPAPYGYGQVHDRESIDAALRTAQPYRTLGYHPGDAAHGTHVADIAAGNGRAGGSHGLAPDASLVFVHLANRGTSGLATLGDSVRLLEAVDYIRRVAGGRPWVINLSMGRHGGPHDGSTLVELAFDELLAAAPGRFIVQSAGNYYQTRTHATGVVADDRTTTLTFRTHPDDTTPNELEIWYGHDDEFTVRLTPPGSPAGRWVHLGGQSAVTAEGAAVGRLYHRARDPNNHDHHVDAFLSPSAPAGTWTVHLRGQRVTNGRFHAWLERDNRCPHCQARFTVDSSEPTGTIGTIACGRIPLVVGAYDAHDPTSPVAAFSSSGPTRSHHTKPDLLAPGADVLAARSAHPDSNASPGKLIRKSGTSMAAPHVTGAVALCLEAFNGQIDARGIRQLILQTTRPATPAPSARTGAGYLDVPRLLDAAKRQALIVSLTADHQEDVMPPDVNPTSRLAAAPAHAFREFLYHPGDDVAEWVARHFEVLARPGQTIDGSPQRGDVLIDVPIGRPGPGTCTTIQHRYATPLRLGPGQLLLHPRANYDGAESPADAPAPTPTHVRRARRIWARLFSASTALRAVTIEDLSSAPSALIARSDFAAWTNSPTTVYVRDLGAVDDAVWEAILHHESLHVKQFQAAGGKPPSDYTTLMRYERDAYAESAQWVARTHPDQRDIASQMRDTASKLRDRISRTKQATKNPTKRNQQYRDFLLAQKLLPPHSTIGDLYTRTPVPVHQPHEDAKTPNEAESPASPPDRRKGITFSKESRISASDMFSKIKASKKLQPWMKNAIRVRGNRLFAKDSFKMPTGASVPRWFQLFINTARSNTVHVTTGAVKMTKSGVRLVGDYEAGDLPGMMVTVGANQKVFMQTPNIPDKYSDGVVTTGMWHTPMLDEHAGWDGKNGLRSIERNLVVIANRQVHEKSNINIDDEKVLETFFHEIAAHQGVHDDIEFNEPSVSAQDRTTRSSHSDFWARHHLLGASPTDSDLIAKTVADFFDVKLDMSLHARAKRIYSTPAPQRAPRAKPALPR